MVGGPRDDANEGDEKIVEVLISNGSVHKGPVRG